MRRTPDSHLRPFNVVEASIAALHDALAAGTVTSVGLVEAYLDRIEAYDRHGPMLNSVPVLNPRVLDDARESDARRSQGEAFGPLDGIPYTVKDSYLTAGLPAACGSPAFRDLVATRDAFAVERLRAAGAVLVGRTTMPPMANGGMQRGLHGRAESPYNADYLTAAYASGSSNGSGTATAASLAAFGLGEETWSSGRSPASNNGLVAYTPSRGLISVRGNWPLVPTMDVVVPHTRSVPDLLQLLDVLVVDDPETRGDLWRSQPWVPLPQPSQVRPARYLDLLDTEALRGRRMAVPRMYVGHDAESPRPVVTRPSVLALWRQARADLERLGVEVVETDFPVVARYENEGLEARGLVPPGFLHDELWDLSVWAWDDFLAANADPVLHRLADVDGALIDPPVPGQLPDRWGDDVELADYVERARSGVVPPDRIATLPGGLEGLEQARRGDLEDWMDAHGYDAVVFPAVADLGPADADRHEASADVAWRNGTWVANGNLVPRHLGIPTVTVTMGLLADIAMPVGLTFAGRAYDDSALLSYAAAYESSGERRGAPPRTPALPDVASASGAVP
jgi:amidase